MRGIYTEPVIERVYTQREAMRRMVGVVDGRGDAVDGLELALDSLLRGEERVTRLARDSHGARIDAPDDDAPEAGDDVVLTINQQLQEIAERALADALVGMGADGGDIVILDPHDGEILAMASRRSDPRTSASPAVTEPFEPGSTLKPFIAAALLELQRAKPDEIVNTENGKYVLDGRTITDEHKKPEMTSRRRDPLLEQHRHRQVRLALLADRGVRGAARLRLRHAHRSAVSGGGVGHAAVAEGVVEAVSGLAGDGLRDRGHAAAARGGVRCDRERRAAARAGARARGPRAGRHGALPSEPRVVRRVMAASVAAEVRHMLLGVVTGGTSKDAAMLNFMSPARLGRRAAPSANMAMEPARTIRRSSGSFRPTRRST